MGLALARNFQERTIGNAGGSSYLAPSSGGSRLQLVWWRKCAIRVSRPFTDRGCVGGWVVGGGRVRRVRNHPYMARPIAQLACTTKNVRSEPPKRFCRTMRTVVGGGGVCRGGPLAARGSFARTALSPQRHANIQTPPTPSPLLEDHDEALLSLYRNRPSKKMEKYYVRAANRPSHIG